MPIDVSTPWHKASFDTFLNERLPELLAERLPLAGYQVTETDIYTFDITVTLAQNGHEVTVVYGNLPQPDSHGIFQLDGKRGVPTQDGDPTPYVVLPLAEHERLDTAVIRCVGERLFDFIAERLGHAPADLPWDETLARAWFPLNAWIGDFMRHTVGRFSCAQHIDRTNWIARHTHLRRLIIPEPGDVIAPGQFGRVCPFEMPEGPNLGHIFTIAVGAEIRDQKLVIVNNRPEATLGLSASAIPFIEHDDPNRVLMGANMLRQWIPQQTPELALVQTGLEPDATLVPEFWAGRNLLTAFIAWGTGTFEDAVVVSERCAQRFDAPYPLEIGDKMSNRHGTKGVVGQILPDDEMPHLPDGTPVDLIFNFANQHRRMNFGEIREAVVGRIAAVTEGKPVIVPPFAAPSADDLRARLTTADLPESGMETLTMGKDGPPLENPSTVGYVYWGRLTHLAQSKLHTFTIGEWGQVQGEMEHFMLRDLGALENVREGLNTRSVRSTGAETLSARVAAGPVAQAPPPTPMFRDLVRRLRVAGIEAALGDDRLTFRFAAPQENALKLAQPVPHPWLRDRLLTEIALPEYQDSDEGDEALRPTDDIWLSLLTPQGGWSRAPQRPSTIYTDIVEANDRLARMLAGHTPQKLVNDAVVQLESRVQALFDALLTPVHLRLSERLNFSARTVLVPGTALTLEQVGIPDEMAWALFGPLVTRELGGDENAVTTRTERATQTLDAAMAKSWVIINRAPTFTPTALIAFHPVRMRGHALHLHPLVCKWLNADFDGDQAAVMLPVTEAAQREAGERLSVAAHLTRDPELVADLLPALDALWGLSKLSLRPEGLEEIEQITGEPVAAPGGFVTSTSLADAMRVVLPRDGIQATISILDKLMQRGFEVAKASGASLNPFAGSTTSLPSQAAGDDPDQWARYAETIEETLAANNDYANVDLGPQLLMVKARGTGLWHLAMLVGGRGTVMDVDGTTAIIQNSNVEGLSASEVFACVPGARRGLAQLLEKWQEMGRTFRERNVSRSFNVLTRALRAKHPGLVFARAAANEEIDPLTDVESRLLVGLDV